MSEDFGTLLAALRTSKVIWGYPANGVRHRRVETTLSQNELARRAGVDPSYVNRLELGISSPSAKTVERLAEALDLGALARARLFVAAGRWPWPSVTGDALDVLLSAALAIADGDYRPLDAHAPHSTRDARSGQALFRRDGAILEAR